MIAMHRSIRLAVAGIAIALAAGCATTRTQESTGEYIDDTTLTTKVKAVLLHDSQVSGLAINVETFKGVVQLSGFAKNDGERRKAAELARAVKGVSEVRNDIIIK